jgi:hypothetical protein
MSQVEIKLFSVNNVTQEEKDFLIYKYGDDLEKIMNEERYWWVKAF